MIPTIVCVDIEVPRVPRMGEIPPVFGTPPSSPTEMPLPTPQCADVKMEESEPENWHENWVLEVLICDVWGNKVYERWVENL